MNCKPGDLAVIVNTSAIKSRPNIGMLVEVVTWLQPEWRCQPIHGQRAPLNKDGLPTPSGFVCVLDKNLRPIRDPGDDAKDETLQWLPVPSVKETA